MMTTGNQLASAASAYLHSAAHQPVPWHPWGSEAFARASAEDKPILLDIGAVWCHWCHVMDAESYEDPSLADFLSRHFVCVKVDRDERPDVDARYQRAVQAITGQGGWPLTAFLTPDGEVFYGGTYFPPEGKYGRPGFRTVLEQVLDVYRNQRDRVGVQAGALRQLLADHLDEVERGDVTPRLLEAAVDGMSEVFDSRHGGFGTQPKFPHPTAVTLLLHVWQRSRGQRLREMIDQTLVGMARGGIHDQLGGGFHRYSVDARWIVPHFEKMAYDNSELLRVYLDAHAAFGTEEYAEVARGIVRWVREVLADPAGGYGASQDADVGLHDDGDYFTWTRSEAADALTAEELEVAAAYYDIGTAGEMHHDPSRNVLFVAESVARIATRLGRPETEVADRLRSAQDRLSAARAKRESPFVDRTRYTSWNAMLAGAMLQAGAALDDRWAHDHALLTLTRIRRESPAPDAVGHVPGGEPGLLDDQVQMARAALDAHEATGDAQWLGWAERLMSRVWADYWDTLQGGLFDTSRDREGEGLLPTRAKPVQDAPTPSPNGMAGLVLSRLFEIGGAEIWRERRDALLVAFAGRAAQLGLHGATYLLAADWHLNPAAHLVVVGPEGDAEVERMHRRARMTFLPRKVVQRVEPGAVGSRSWPAPLAALITPSEPRSYICLGTRCLPPAADDREWAQRLAAASHEG